MYLLGLIKIRAISHSFQLRHPVCLKMTIKMIVLLLRLIREICITSILQKTLCRMVMSACFPSFVSSCDNRARDASACLPCMFFSTRLLQCRWYGQIKGNMPWQSLFIKCTKHVKQSEIKSSSMMSPSVYILGQRLVLSALTVWVSLHSLKSLPVLRRFPMEKPV